jgi:hypothetical protein
VTVPARHAAEQASVPAQRSSLAWCSSRPGRGRNASHANDRVPLQDHVATCIQLQRSAIVLATCSPPNKAAGTARQAPSTTGGPIAGSFDLNPDVKLGSVCFIKLEGSSASLRLFKPAARDSGKPIRDSAGMHSAALSAARSRLSPNNYFRAHSKNGTASC